MIKIKDLLITYPQTRSLCRTFVPTLQTKTEETAGVYLKVTEEENEKGKIFAILHCKENPENEKLIFFLENKIKLYYDYEPPKKEKISRENIFEEFLYDLNNDFQKFLKEKRISIDLNKIDLLIGLIHFNKKEGSHYLFFSQIGSLESLLIYKNKKGESNIAQIKESTEVDGNKKTFKIFSNIISGRIKNHSTLLFCTSNVLDFIPLDKIRLIATENDADGINQEIKKILLEASDDQTFCALTTKIKKKEKKKEKKQFNLSFIKKPKKKIPEKYEKISENTNISPVTNNKEKEETTIFEHAGEKKFSPPKKYSLLSPYYTLKYLLKKTYSFFKYILTGRIFIDILKKLKNIPSYYKKLPILRKSLLIASIILIAFFVQSIGHLKQERIKEDKFKYYQELLGQIEGKKNELEASLIYNSQEKAAETLLSIEDLISKLPQDSEEQKQKLLEIKNQIKKLSFKTKLIKEIENVKELVDYSKLTNSPVNSSMLIDNIIYGITEDNNLLEMKLSDLSVEKKDQGQLNLPKATALILSRDNFIVVHENNKFSRINDGKIKPIDIKFPENNTNINYSNIYGDNLYTLSQETNKIYKHLPSGEDFAIGKPWLTEESNLNKAVSMSIDGSIYVLKSDGNILNFFKGKQQGFNFENTNTLLTGGNRILTNANSDYVYVLDSLGKKIAVINKSGKLITQYYSENFINSKDLMIDENNKKIYILANNKIFEIEASHL
jgi:hypothetical protein